MLEHITKKAIVDASEAGNEISQANSKEMAIIEELSEQKKRQIKKSHFICPIRLNKIPPNITGVKNVEYLRVVLKDLVFL